jgi:ribose transport system substrate-binding protein
MRLFIVLIFLYSLVVAKEYKVGFAQDTLANDWRLAQVNEVKEEIKKYPFLDLTILDTKGSFAKQILDIESFINDKYDFIITSPIEAHMTSLVLQKALQQGIKVILIDRGITSQDYTVFIAPNNRLIAKEAGNYIVKHLQKGTVLMLEGVKGATPTIERTEGFEEVIKDYPQIKVIKRRANYLRADAIAVMDELYNQNIKIDAIYSQSDSMLSGVRYVREKQGDNLPLLIVGIDYIAEAKEAIQKNQQDVSFTYPTCGKEGVKAIIDIINGKKHPKNIVIDTIKVDKTNVDSIEPIF